MNQLYPHHTELPGGIINEFLTSEECLLAQLEWAHKQYMKVADYREAYERYEKIDQQCQTHIYGIYGTSTGMAAMSKLFTDIGLDQETERKKYKLYFKNYLNHQLAEKAYKEFLVKEGRAYLSVVYKPVED